MRYQDNAIPARMIKAVNGLVIRNNKAIHIDLINRLNRKYKIAIEGTRINRPMIADLKDFGVILFVFNYK